MGVGRWGIQKGSVLARFLLGWSALLDRRSHARGLGYGDDDRELVPAARIFDVTTNQERWFAGPMGDLVFDEYLFSFSKEYGMMIWDVTTGERLLHDPAFCPTAYHRGARQFLTLLSDGRFQLSRLIGTAEATNGAAH